MNTNIVTITDPASDRGVAQNAVYFHREITDAHARALAATWQTSGPIGNVLAQLANTGTANADELLDDIEATRREYADTTDVVCRDMHALSLWVRRQINAQGTGHGLRVGDIFVQRWGYDQTNVYYFEVRKVTKTTVTVQRIYATQISDGPQSMTGTSTPHPGKYIGDPMRRKVHTNKWDTTPRIEPHPDQASASLWDGMPQRFSTYA